MQLALTRPHLISLAVGFTDNESLPVGEVRDLLSELLDSADAAVALQYGTTQGDSSLRRLTSEHLQAQDASRSSAPYSPERIIITSGSQQLLYMVSEALCDEGDSVLVEDPTYFVYLGILQSHGLNARGIRLERDGISLAHLEEVLNSLKASGELRRVRALYLVSYFQNPTGATTRFDKKSAILNLLSKYERAAGHPIYLVEDAAYRELRFAGPDVKSALAARRGHDRVIYAGTYSKPFATGARVGFGVLPEPVFTAVLRIKGNHDFGTSNLLQRLLARALASGTYSKHLRDLQKRYASKAAIMRAALKAHFPENIEIWEPSGGLYFWARLPKGVKTGTRSKMFQRALGKRVLYVPGELCYADDSTRRKPNHEMRLSFGGAPERNIREGIKRLGSVIARQ